MRGRIALTENNGQVFMSINLGRDFYLVFLICRSSFIMVFFFVHSMKCVEIISCSFDDFFFFV